MEGALSLWQMPSWQAGPGVIESHSSGAPCAASAGSFCREVPDVAAYVDPNTGYIVYWSDFGHNSTPWVEVGGTSAAAPVWAGLSALADASGAERVRDLIAGLPQPEPVRDRRRAIARERAHRRDEREQRRVPGRLGLRHGDRVGHADRERRERPRRAALCGGHRLRDRRHRLDQCSRGAVRHGAERVGRAARERRDALRRQLRRRRVGRRSARWRRAASPSRTRARCG